MADEDKETISRAMRMLAARKWKKTTKKEAKAQLTQASRAYWDKLTPEQRSTEMKRRAKIRKRWRKARPTSPRKKD